MKSPRSRKNFPDVMFIVDAVSSMSAVKLEFDALGIDVLLAGTQKAFAMPPGLAVFVCSPAALAKAATAPDRGYYFDFVEFQKNAEQSMTPSTPSIGHVYALASKLEDIFAEGLEARFRPPQKTGRDDARLGGPHGFTLFPKPALNPSRSPASTTAPSPAAGGGRAKLQKLVKEQGFLIDGGYGKIKGTTFRISNMGDETEATMNQLYAALDGR
jgi:aspartate aminotransferase-like enzyme